MLHIFLMLWSISACVENMGSCEELTAMFPTINTEKHVKRVYMHTWDKRNEAAPIPPPAYTTLSLFAYEETMSILATADFSQAVYLARKVSDANKSALCSSFGCACAHTHSRSHTRPHKIAAQHGGFLVTEVTCLWKT